MNQPFDLIVFYQRDEVSFCLDNPEWMLQVQSGEQKSRATHLILKDLYQ